MLSLQIILIYRNYYLTMSSDEIDHLRRCVEKLSSHLDATVEKLNNESSSQLNIVRKFISYIDRGIGNNF